MAAGTQGELQEGRPSALNLTGSFITKRVAAAPHGLVHPRRLGA